MTEFVTPKGTKLPFLDLKGKQYLMVAHRILWAREEHPDWTFETEIIKSCDEFTTMKATVKNETGKVIATAHKTEHKAHFIDHIEKAETSALGRALALCGYGTQFAQELMDTADADDKDPRVADAPLEPKKATTNTAGATTYTPPTTSGGYVIGFGKYKGKAIHAIPVGDLQNYSSYLQRKAQEENKPLKGKVAEFVEMVSTLDSMPQMAPFNDEPNWEESVAKSFESRASEDF